jgi:hypothetical protein
MPVVVFQSVLLSDDFHVFFRSSHIVLSALLLGPVTPVAWDFTEIIVFG